MHLSVYPPTQPKITLSLKPHVERNMYIVWKRVRNFFFTIVLIFELCTLSLHCPRVQSQTFIVQWRQYPDDLILLPHVRIDTPSIVWNARLLIINLDKV